MISSAQPNEANANSESNSEFVTPSAILRSKANGYSGDRLTTNSTVSPQLPSKQRLQPQRQGSWWERVSLRTKATALAIALGVIPVVAVGAADYLLSRKEIRKDLIANQQETTIALGDQVGRFMFERYGDIQILSGLRVFTDPKISQITSRQEKEAQLKRFSEVNGFYDSIALFELNGNLIVKTGGELGKNSQGQITNNIKDRDHFQAVLKTDRPVISQPSISKTTGKPSIFMAAPVKDTVTGRTIAVVRTRMPAQVLDDLLRTEDARLTEVLDASQANWHLIDSQGKIFVAEEGNQALGEDARSAIPVFAQMQAAKTVASAEGYDVSDPDKQLVSYAPMEQLKGVPDLNWSVLIHEDTAIVFAQEQRLLLTLLLGTSITILLVSAIAAYAANRATRPILAATNAVEKLGQGELDTRIAVKGQDELATLGSNINGMAGQIQTLLVEQEESARQQLATQAEAGRKEAKNAEEQKLAKETLQKSALDLLIEVDPVSRGDLTIRASVTENEIGTIADSYNATIASLRKIVIQVQGAAGQMAATTSSSEVSVQGLSQEALRQTEEITAALDRIGEMSKSIRAVAMSAELAEAAVKEANQTVEAGDAAMNRTVDGILAIRETVAETATKVKQLGDSSQKISKVVNLISTFAAQTNLLALKASIEAARAGEEGRGFAVLADEVRILARQSAQATSEIESLVTSIQSETNEVVAAMEAGTQQVVTGTKLVDETRQSLNKITAVSGQIGSLVEAIASAAMVQTQTSEDVTQSMSDVAAIARQTSNEANSVSASFKELLAVAQQLQVSAGQFKVS